MRTASGIPSLSAARSIGLNLKKQLGGISRQVSIRAGVPRARANPASPLVSTRVLAENLRPPASIRMPSAD